MTMRRRQLIPNLLLSLGAILITLGAAEIAWRIVEIVRLPPPPESAEVLWSRYHPVVGWWHLPGSRAGKVLIDERGFRVGKGEEIRRPLGSRVIAAYGDSFTFGDGVRGYEAWPYLLGEMLRSAGWEVVNAGVCAYGVDQMYLLSREEGPPLRPEITLAAVDSWDMTRVVKSRWKPGGREKPRFALRDGRLRLLNVPVPLKMEDDRKLLTWRDVLFDDRRLHLLDRLMPPPEELEIPEIPDQEYRERKVEPGRHGEEILLSQMIMEQWRREVEAEGGRFILVLLPVRKRQTCYHHSYLIAMKDNLARQGMEIIDCLPAFLKGIEDGRDLFSGPHPSEEGHAVIAGEVCRYLDLMPSPRGRK